MSRHLHTGIVQSTNVYTRHKQREPSKHFLLSFIRLPWNHALTLLKYVIQRVCIG